MSYVIKYTGSQVVINYYLNYYMEKNYSFVYIINVKLM